MEIDTSELPFSSRNSIYTIQNGQLQLATTSEVSKGIKTKLFGKTSRKRLETFLSFTILIIAVLVISLCVTIYLVVDTKMRVPTSNLCFSHECIRSASAILSSMNKSQDPCEDFYNFVCGNFKMGHAELDPFPEISWFMINEAKMLSHITDFILQNNQKDDPEFVRKARKFCLSCIKFDEMKENGFEVYLDILNKIGLPKDPFSNPLSAEQWLVSLAKIRRYTGLNIIIGIATTDSYINSSTGQIFISSPDEAGDIIDEFYWGNNNKKLLQEYMTDTVKSKWIKAVVQLIDYVMKSGAGETQKDELEEHISSLVNLYTSLWNVENIANTSLPSSELYDVISVEEFQIYLDENTKSGKSKLNLVKYLNALYEDVLDEYDFNQTELQVSQKVYFKLISEFLEDTEDKNIGVYIWWTVLENLALHINTELSHLIISVWKKLYVDYGEPRAKFCVDVTNKLMPLATQFFTVQRVETKTVNKIVEMIDSIKNVFAQHILALPWMNDSTKRSSIEKLKAMSSFVGTPYGIIGLETVNEFYNVTIEKNTYFTNFLHLLDRISYLELYSVVLIDDPIWFYSQFLITAIRISSTFSYSLSGLTTEGAQNPDCCKQKKLIFNPSTINAFHYSARNLIIVPAGLLNFPFYNLGTESLVYGAIGTVISHEITHGFDTIGRMYDKSGNVHPWWSNSSIEQYTNRTNCFVEEFNNQFISHLNDTVDGVLTLSENLADDGGLKFAYWAYKQYVQTRGVQPRLPGLHDFSDEQLFFMSFANQWCSYETDEIVMYYLKKDEHSPRFVRVNVALQNFMRFSDVWNCPAGTKMNPEKKCDLWN